MKVKNSLYKLLFRSCAGGALVLVALSCRSMPAGIYDEEHPAHYQGARSQNCVTAQQDPLPIKRSYAAMLRTLKERKWNIKETVVNFEHIIASACLGIRSFSFGDCVTMTFLFDANGDVMAKTDPETPVIRKMDGHVKRWMIGVDKLFYAYRCMSDDEVQKTLVASGLVSPSPPPLVPAPSPAVAQPISQ